MSAGRPPPCSEVVILGLVLPGRHVLHLSRPQFSPLQTGVLSFTRCLCLCRREDERRDGLRIRLGLSARGWRGKRDLSPALKWGRRALLHCSCCQTKPFAQRGQTGWALPGGAGDPPEEEARACKQHSDTVHSEYPGSGRGRGRAGRSQAVQMGRDCSPKKGYLNDVVKVSEREVMWGPSLWWSIHSMPRKDMQHPAQRGSVPNVHRGP